MIELLVVLGIVSVLVSVLLPALSRARASADAVRCASNLRQIATISILYADAHGGLSPALGVPFGREPFWALVVQRSAGEVGTGGQLYEGDSVLVCPAADRRAVEPLTRSYAVSVTGLAGAPGDRADFDTEQVHIRTALIDRPSETPWYLDSASAPIDGTAPPSSRTLGTIDFRDPSHIPARLGLVHGSEDRAFQLTRFDASVTLARAVRDEWRTPLP